jgi:hypothetical protein
MPSSSEATSPICATFAGVRNERRDCRATTTVTPAIITSQILKLIRNRRRHSTPLLLPPSLMIGAPHAPDQYRPPKTYFDDVSRDDCSVKSNPIPGVRASESKVAFAAS